MTYMKCKTTKPDNTDKHEDFRDMPSRVLALGRRQHDVARARVEDDVEGLRRIPDEDTAVVLAHVDLAAAVGAAELAEVLLQRQRDRPPAHRAGEPEGRGRGDCRGAAAVRAAARRGHPSRRAPGARAKAA